MILRFLQLTLLSTTICGSFCQFSLGITTSGGQPWDYEPDAWSRANNSSTAYFGWDVFEPNGMALGFGEVLDDSTPDLGAATTALDPRIYQGTNGIQDPAPTSYGHRSGSGNFYSGFGPADVVLETITSQAPAGGTGGFTTVVLQVIGGAPGGQGSQPIEDLSFQILESGWTNQKDLYGTLATGTGVYWQEWTAAGDNLPFSIRITSGSSSRSIDAFQVDTYWSPSEVTINNRSSIGVPEPTSLLAITIGGLATIFVLRRQGKCWGNG
jgi:hypothetical protein